MDPYTLKEFCLLSDSEGLLTYCSTETSGNMKMRFLTLPRVNLGSRPDQKVKKKIYNLDSTRFYLTAVRNKKQMVNERQFPEHITHKAYR